MDFKLPPYLVSQVLLQKHYAKRWEDEKKQQADISQQTEQTTPSKSENNNKSLENNATPNNRTIPWQMNVNQDFPSLKETSVKQKRVTPTPVQTTLKPNIKNSPVKYESRPRPSMTSTPLSLCDVMVIKTKKSKKGSQANKSKETSEPVTNNDSKVVENLIQDKDKNKLFDRILNKGKTKEPKCLDKDVKNNNEIIENYLFAKKVKFTLKPSRVSLWTEKKEECNEESKILEQSKTSGKQITLFLFIIYYSRF